MLGIYKKKHPTLAAVIYDYLYFYNKKNYESLDDLQKHQVLLAVLNDIPVEDLKDTLPESSELFKLNLLRMLALYDIKHHFRQHVFNNIYFQYQDLIADVFEAVFKYVHQDEREDLGSTFPSFASSQKFKFIQDVYTEKLTDRSLSI